MHGVTNSRMESVVIAESALTFLPATEEMVPLLLFLTLKLPEQTHPLIVSKQGQKSSMQSYMLELSAPGANKQTNQCMATWKAAEMKKDVWCELLGFSPLSGLACTSAAPWEK